MRILFGIGNPGKKYFFNRHNAGFLLLDYFAEKHSLKFKPSKFDYHYAEGNLAGSFYFLIKPATFVNNSGTAALHAVQKYEADIKDFLVLVDDVNLDFAAFRIRSSGGDGGHNGLNSIIYHLNSVEFPRVRIGVGSEFQKGDMAQYVLTDFNKDELTELNRSFKQCEFLLEEFIKGGLSGMLNANSRLSKNNMENKKDPDNQN